MNNSLPEKFQSWQEKIIAILHQRDGKLTGELAQEVSSLGLGKLPKRLLPDATVDVVCGYCSTGCALTVHQKEGQAVNLTPSVGYPVNLGEACPKGWEALTPLSAPDRLQTPLLKDASGNLVPVSWDKALKVFAERFKNIQEKYGKSSISFLSTGQICTEEMMLLGVLAKFGMGMVHCDSNTRQCMATAATAYKQSFGFDAPPFAYKDFEESDVLVFVGANPCIAHPILWQRVCMNRHHPEIIVVDPRKTETAMAATRHYPIAPKSDLALFYGLAQILIAQGDIDRKYIDQSINNFEEFKAHVAAFTPEAVSQATGLSVIQIREFASIIASGRRVSFWWTMGINQSYEGVRAAQAIINLALITGNMGRPGTGANSITGQCNAMGSRIFGNITDMMCGHDLLNPVHRKKIADILGIDSGLIPHEYSLAYDQILDRIPDNKIKGLWLVATNPAHSWIHQSRFSSLMKQLEFLVVQDMYATTEMAKMADLILPAAGWGEKEGTMINSERRIGLLKRVARAPGLALADFYIFKLVAQYWGCADLFQQWSSPEATFQIMKNISSGTPCDITGIRDYRMIDEQGGIQWPYPENGGLRTEARERRLFEDGKFYFPDGKAKLLFENVKPVPEAPDEKYPFILLTGRGTSAQWHTQTRTGKSAILRQLYPKDIYMEINPGDAGRMKIGQNQWVYVSTRRGQARVKAMLAVTVSPGQIFIPMHYPETNLLTFPAFDAYSRQPSYKFCAARVSVSPWD